MTQKTFNDFLRDLGQRESNGNYKTINSLGYVGKYQMGEPAMVDAGYYKAKPFYNNKWDGEFTGKDGIYSLKDFLENPQAQENAQIAFKQKQWKYIQNLAQKYSGTNINNIPITESGMLAATHLLGQGNLKKYLESNGTFIPKDGYGTSIEEYLQKFANYDVSNITNPNNKLHEIPNTPPTFTREDIARMSFEEFVRNESEIMKQLSKGTIQNEKPDYPNFKNPLTGKDIIFTVEAVSKMSGEEYAKNEAEIMAQIKTIGLPRENEIPKEKSSSYSGGSSNKNSSGDGRWVTINGNHVFIEK